MAHHVDGWEELDLPSVVDDLTRLYAGYGAHMSAYDLEEIAREVNEYVERTGIIFGNLVPFVSFLFAMHGGEMIIAVPRHEDLNGHTARSYRRGADLYRCSDVGARFVEIFERRILPAEPHAAETLKT